MKNFKYIILFSFIFTLFIVFFISKELKAEPSSDAIAIRVLPNPQHYSAQQWYDDKGFRGSPQQLIIDGYEAVRDNHTVYINAANVYGYCRRYKNKCFNASDCKPNEKCSFDHLYTNIYVIAFNLDASPETENIFNQILDTWKVNTNISRDVERGVCNITQNLFCLEDDQCPNNEYCTSFKAKIIRDTKRLADFEETILVLDKYKEKHGFYPRLSVGTYIPRYSISTWPSWQKSLSYILDVSLPVDPINALGKCPSSYEPSTCWSQTELKFVTQLPDLPESSHVYTYQTNDAGSSYILMANFETELVKEEYIVNAVDNSRPVFFDINFKSFVEKDEDVIGFISASDVDGDDLTWSIEWPETSSMKTWTEVPRLEDTSDQQKKRIFIKGLKYPGDYLFSVIVDDNKSEFNSKAIYKFKFNVIGEEKCSFNFSSISCFF